MYLKGYRISYADQKSILLPKWDFGGDKSFTNRVWNGLIQSIRTFPPDVYPLQIADLDAPDTPLVIIDNIEAFEHWLHNDFDKKDYLTPLS